MSRRVDSSHKTVLFPETPVPLIDLELQNRPLLPEIHEAVRQVCESGCFVLGPEVQALEASVAKYCDANHAVACASGSDALLLALLAMGIGHGDEVILPSFTFFATAGAVWHTGATPIFADIDPATYCVDPASVENKITSRTKAIIPVHLYGQCAEMEPLWRMAAQHHVPIIEDAAQAIGAAYRGRRAGVLGEIGCFSFYPTKNLGGFGDGGILTTNDDDLAERLRLLRVHGMQPRYHHKIVGLNSRLGAIPAAILNVKFKHLEDWTQRRTENALRYHQLMRDYDLHRVLALPNTAAERRHVWNQYVVRVPDGRRDELRSYLAERQIGSEIYYPIPVHKQECFRGMPSAQVSLPETERAAAETLALPIFPELTPIQQCQVVHSINEFFHGVPAASAPPRSNQRKPA